MWDMVYGMITLNDIWFQTSQQVRQQLPRMNQQLHLPQLPHQVPCQRSVLKMNKEGQCLKVLLPEE